VSLPPPDLHHAISQVEGKNTAPIERATAAIDANEVANDIKEEEHLPEESEDDEDENPEVEEEGTSEDDKEVPAPEMGVDEEGNEQRPVRTVQEAPAEDLATYGGRKQAAIHQIQALLGEKVLIKKAEVSSWNGQLLKSHTLQMRMS
jgi:hypothetical protein